MSTSPAASTGAINSGRCSRSKCGCGSTASPDALQSPAMYLSHTRAIFKKLVLAAWVLFVPVATTVAEEQGTPAGTGSESTGPGGSRPGRFRVGPLYLTPVMRIGTIGLDTN